MRSKWLVWLIALLTLVILAFPASHAMRAAGRGGRPGSATSPFVPVAEQSGLNESVGINDNGSALINGNLINYSYSTNGLLGYFAFYGGDFYSGPPVNESAFSVQLNSNFNVTSNMTLWAQDVFQVNYVNGLYMIDVLDNLWNSTPPNFSVNPSLVSGNGTFSTYGNRTYYYDWAKVNGSIVYYVTRPPFYLYAAMDLTQNSYGYPQVYMYYRFVNSTYDSGWVLYDVITVEVPSSNPMFLVGVQPRISSQYPNYPFVTQWVVCGEYDGAQLDVYSWNATMALYYWYDGNWYSVPDAVSLQPQNFTAFVTAENVDQYDGIVESYNSQTGLVYQSQGQNVQEFLWQPSVYYELNGDNLTLFLTPKYGEWLVTISGNDHYNSSFQYSPATYVLPPGTYQVNATLYAGSTPIYTFSRSIVVSGGVVDVESPAPFYVNGFQHMAGSYEFEAPVNLTFPLVYYASNESRLVLQYLLVNGQRYYNNTILIAYNANVTAVYRQQYYVTLPFQLWAYVNGTYLKVGSGWYDAGTRIVVPAQVVYSGGTRYVIYAEANYTVTSPSTISPPYYTQYYVEVNEEVPAEIDGVNATLASGWYNASTRIVVFNFYYFNDTVRLAIRSNVSQVTLSGPMVIDVFSALYQYYVTVALPNGTLSGWYSAGSTINLPTVIYNGSLERYVISQSSELVVDRPINLTALYVRQFYVLIKMPNGTISGWYDAGSSITLPALIYNGGYERYALNQTGTVFVDRPINLTALYVRQFYVLIKMPNGTISGWYDAGSAIKLPSVIYNGTAERYVINQSDEITVDESINAAVEYVKQFYVDVALPNGTISGWYNEGSEITLPRVIYVGNATRYVINQSDTLTVSSPISEAPSYVEQFLVTVNGASSWYNAGSTIRLYEPVPWYETLTWVGSYTLPNGANVTVCGPVVESARTSINVGVVGGIAGAVVVAAAVGVVAIRRR